MIWNHIGIWAPDLEHQISEHLIFSDRPPQWEDAFVWSSPPHHEDLSFDIELVSFREATGQERGYGTDRWYLSCLAWRQEQKPNTSLSSSPGPQEAQAFHIIQFLTRECSITGWWFGPFFIFPEILGMSLSQLTNSYIFQRGFSSTTNQLWLPIEYP